MSFGIYLVGCLILIGGLALAANMLRVPRKWISFSGKFGPTGPSSL